MTPRARAWAEGGVALLSGVIFALGLAFAGMTRAEKVMGFLNFFRGWDPSLMFVMGGAIAVHAVAWRVIQRRPSPLLSARFLVPTRRDLDARLLLGAAIFGVGWGLGGFCPGPGLASIVAARGSAVAFALAMLAGSSLAARLEEARSPALDVARARASALKHP